MNSGRTVEDRLRFTVENTIEPCFVITGDGAFVRVNAVVLELFAVSDSAELMSRTLFDFVESDDERRLEDALRECARGGEPVLVDRCRLNPDVGNSARADFEVRPLDDEDGGEHRLFVVRPIVGGADAHPEAILGQAVMEESSLAVFIVDNQGRLVSANPAAVDYLDLEDEYLGGRLEEVAPDAVSLLADTGDHGEARIDISTRGGIERRLRYVSRLMGDGRHRFVLMRDETEAIKTEKRKRRASQLSIAGRMASHLSHQMKNPLSTLMAGLQGLEKDRDLSDDNRRMVELLIEEVRSMDLSLKQLLQAAVARMSSPSVVPVHRIVTTAVEGLQGAADMRNISIGILQGPEDSTVTVDEIALTQALRNVLQSSAEHVGPAEKLRCGWRRLGKGETAARFPGFEETVVGIFSEYTGSALPEESSVSEIFRAFGSSTRSAAGLGVSLARDIVESHGGILVLNPVPSRGMSFEILLSGAKPSPCWIVVGDARCSAETCEVFARAAERNDATAGALCRLIKQKARKDRDGVWPETCRNCVMFESFNLLHYYQSD